MNLPEKCLIAYFSGTGGTKMAAGELERQLAATGAAVETMALGYRNSKVNRQRLSGIKDNISVLVLMYPVYALDACEPVYEFLEQLPNGAGMGAAVISVSGGGEKFPNTACRYRVINKLEKKNYNVFYENMLIMPSNCLTQLPDELAAHLLKILPVKIADISGAVALRRRRRSGFPWLAWLPSFLGYVERYGTKRLGKKFVVDGKCTKCGWCIANCPQKNIDVCNNCGKIKFGIRCVLCLRCIYGCPAKAITLRSWIKIFSEYDLQKLEQKYEKSALPAAGLLCKGWKWKALREYLSVKNK